MYNTHTTKTSMLPVGVEPSTPARDRQQILAFDRLATGIGRLHVVETRNIPAPAENKITVAHSVVLDALNTAFSSI
jgi:hypothetical protein